MKRSGPDQQKATEPVAPMYLVAELSVRDRDKLLQYAAEVAPLMTSYGGEILATSAAGVDVVEGDWVPDLLVVHRWRSLEDFDAFWESKDYAPIRALRHEACESRIVVFDGPQATRMRPR
jgi:uncharacterized protein (DUF1330 family)